jgi:hypothetical protein
MDKQTFERLIKESVASGASKEDALGYIVRGYKLGDDLVKELTGGRGVPAGAAPSGVPKKPTAKRSRAKK